MYLENIEVIISRHEAIRGGTVAIVPIKVVEESGREQEAVAKVFRKRGSAEKEEKILDRLNSRGIPGVARVLAKIEGDITGKNLGEITILETRVNGNPLGLTESPIPRDIMRLKASGLFHQLSATSGDRVLINEDIAFCGDISPSNVLETPERYTIVDWSGRFGLYGGRELTRGYIAPEVLRREELISFVEADTYSLGCLLLRLKIGKQEFDNLIKNCVSGGGCVNYKDVEQLIEDSSLRNFFKVVLSIDPNERILKGVTEPGEHYRKLAEIFGSTIP